MKSVCHESRIAVHPSSFILHPSSFRLRRAHRPELEVLQEDVVGRDHRDRKPGTSVKEAASYDIVLEEAEGGPGGGSRAGAPAGRPRTCPPPTRWCSDSRWPDTP